MAYTGFKLINSIFKTKFYYIKSYNTPCTWYLIGIRIYYNKINFEKLKWYFKTVCTCFYYKNATFMLKPFWQIHLWINVDCWWKFIWMLAVLLIWNFLDYWSMTSEVIEGHIFIEKINFFLNIICLLGIKFYQN